MDPRHPELAIERMVELMTQFNLILKDMKHSTVSSQLGQLEREGGLVVQEICLVAPRLHEAMMQTSRQRRHDLSHGVVVDMSKYEVPDGVSGEEVGIVEEPVRGNADVIGEENIGGESRSMKKPAAKKTTRKKKTAKKADEECKGK